MTGTRRGEVVGLRWSDVQLDRHRLTVNQAATVVDGDETVDAPKARRSRRVIDIDGDTTALRSATAPASARCSYGSA